MHAYIRAQSARPEARMNIMYYRNAYDVNVARRRTLYRRVTRSATDQLELQA